MRFWLDTEFNGYGGELISLALVSDDDDEFYEAVEIRAEPTTWVRVNVMPILNQPPIPPELLATRLRNFLGRFDRAHIIADWPDDIAYFCRALITAPGEMITTPPLTFELRHDLPGTSGTSEIPHNALADARALRKSGLRL